MNGVKSLKEDYLLQTIFFIFIFFIATMNEGLKSVLQRYYVLFIFTLLTSNQCLFWFTPGSIDPAMLKIYYRGMDSATIDLLLNWGPIMSQHDYVIM